MATVLVTGAGRGIGFALARQLQGRGDEVIAVSRSATPELLTLGCRVELVDVAQEASVVALARRLGMVKLDVLVHNAGAYLDEELGHIDFDSLRQQFEVNTLGPLRVTEALLPRMGEGGKIGIVSSRMGSMTDNTSGGYYGYRASKAAVNAIGVSLARDLAPRGVAVALLHPGYVRTRMTDNQGLIDADESAAGLIERLDELTLERSGGFWHKTGERLDW